MAQSRLRGGSERIAAEAFLLMVQAYQAQVLNKEIATSMQLAIPPALRSLFQSKQIITELVPFLMRIISPPLKPVSLSKLPDVRSS